MESEKNNVRIRSMVASDIDAIFEIDKKTGTMERAFTYENVLESFIGGEIGCSFIAELDDKVVGFVLATITYVPEAITEICQIQILGVDPDYRRRGIAGRLIGALADSCYSKGIKSVRVMVDKHDTELQRLFDKLEFRQGNLIDYSLTLE